VLGANEFNVLSQIYRLGAFKAGQQRTLQGSSLLCSISRGCNEQFALRQVPTKGHPPAFVSLQCLPRSKRIMKSTDR
jgi:hypothetical protein